MLGDVAKDELNKKEVFVLDCGSLRIMNDYSVGIAYVWQVS